MTEPRGSIVQGLRNFLASPLALPVRTATALRNLGIRLAGRRLCCGHDGEPGC